MSGVVLEDEIRIPGWVRVLRSFRRWACSEEFPERGRFSFIDGEVWVDMSPEELLSHNQVKGEVAAVVGTIVKQARLGRFFFDRALLTHPAADLSTEPDGMFVSTASLRSGRVRFVESDAGLSRAGRLSRYGARSRQQIVGQEGHHHSASGVLACRCSRVLARRCSRGASPL